MRRTEEIPAGALASADFDLEAWARQKGLVPPYSFMGWADGTWGWRYAVEGEENPAYDHSDMD